MEPQPLAVEPVARNIQRISPVRSFHLTVEIAGGVAGRVFGFVETADPRNAEAALRAIERAIQETPPGPAATFDERAAQLIAGMNRAIAAVHGSGKLAVPASEVSALAAVSSGVQIALAGRNATALRIHRDGRALEAEELLPPADPAASAVFPSFVVGGLGSRDALFLSGRRMFDFLSRDHLARIVASAEPESARETILSALADLEAGVSLSAFVVKLASPKTRTALPDLASPSMDSLDELLDRATVTERLLNPSLQFPLVRGLRALFGKGSKAAPAAIADAGALRPAARSIRAVGNGTFDILTTILAASRSLGEALSAAGATVWRIAVNPDGARRKELAAIRQSLTDRIRAGRAWLLSLPFPARVAFLAALAAGLIFAASIVVVGSSRSRREALASYNAALAAIQDKRDAIEASAIYSDSTRAWTLLDEARALAASLPVGTKNQRATVDRLTGLLEEDAKRLRRETEIENPDIVADLRSSNPDVRAAALAVTDTALLVADAAHRSLWSVPKAGGEPRKIGDLPGAGSVVSSAAGGGALLLTDAPSLLSVGESGAATVPSDFGSGRPSGIALWNDRLYAVDPSIPQITRHNRSGNGYGSGSPWVKSGAEALRDASAIAIDGSVFVGTASGSVLKFHLGQKTDFAPGRVEPSLRTITRIAAPPESAYLYLLVPDTKRLVVLLRETGALVAQYTSPKFDGLSDLALDEKSKAAYLLTSSSLYRVPLTHLQ